MVKRNRFFAVFVGLTLLTAFAVSAQAASDSFKMSAVLSLTGGMAENILDCPLDQRPEIINDHGRQMKARSVNEFHGMPQLFARPRTPNDNPFVESAFGIDREDSVRYFERYKTTRR